jgi:hypothetical protein
VAVDLDVIVDVHAGLHPLAVEEGRGGQRAERGLVEPREQRVAADAVPPHAAGIEIGEQLGDARVEGAERKERLVAESRHDPPLGDLHRDLDFGFVPRFGRARRQDGGAVVGGEFLVRPL